MNKEKLIRHYQWQIRRLNKRIDESDWVKDFAKLHNLDRSLLKPCSMDLNFYEGNKKIALSKRPWTVGKISILIFWMKARNGFINKIIKLRGEE